MPLLEITRAAKVVTITNGLLFIGALISAFAIPLSIRANNRIQEIRASEAARQHTEDQRQIEAATSRAQAADMKARLLRMDLDRTLLRQKGLELRNAQLTISLEREHQARFELEKKLSPRHLSQRQVEILMQSLLPFRGSAIAFTRIQDQEAWEFAGDILRSLYRGGWLLTDNDVGIFAPPEYGVLLCVPEQLQTDPAALALERAFRRADVHFSIRIMRNDQLRLIVGLKPRSP